MKNNLAEDRGGLAYRVKGATLENGIGTSCLEWDSKPVIMTADEAMAPAGHPEEPSELDEAMDWLRALLTTGAVASKEIRSDAKQAGIAWRTIERAKTRLGVKVSKAGYQGKWRWSLPDHSHHEDDPNPSHVGGLGGLWASEALEPSGGAGPTKGRHPPEDGPQNEALAVFAET